MKLLLLLLLLLEASPAAGDAIPPGAAGCPPGTSGRSDHYGQFCAANICKDRSTCPPEQVCQPYALCIQEVNYGSPRGNTYRRWARGSCGRREACPAHARCRVARRCVPRGTPLPDVAEKTTAGGGKQTPGGAPQNRGCGACSHGPGPGAPQGIVALLLLVVLRFRKYV